MARGRNQRKSGAGHGRSTTPPTIATSTPVTPRFSPESMSAFTHRFRQLQCIHTIRTRRSHCPHGLHRGDNTGERRGSRLWWIDSGCGGEVAGLGASAGDWVDAERKQSAVLLGWRIFFLGDGSSLDPAKSLRADVAFRFSHSHWHRRPGRVKQSNHHLNSGTIFERQANGRAQQG